MKKYKVYAVGFFTLFFAANIFAAGHTPLENRISELEAKIARLEALLLNNNQSPALKTVEAPKAASAAKSDNPLYGSMRIALYRSEKGNDKLSEVRSAGNSRFGIKNSHKISDELTATYNLEWGLPNDFSVADSSVRLAYAGIKGDFGDLRIGRDWSGSYEFVGSKVDVFSTTLASTYDDFAYGGATDTGYAGHARIGSALHYRTNLGALKLQLDTEFGDNNKKSGISQYVLAGEYPLQENANIGWYYTKTGDFNDGTRTITANKQYGLALDFKPTPQLSLSAAYFKQSFTDETALTDKTANVANRSFKAFDLAAVLDTNIIGKGGSFRAVYGSLDYDDDVRNDYDQWQIGLRKQYDKYSLFTWYTTTDTEQEENQNEIHIGARYDF